MTGSIIAVLVASIVAGIGARAVWGAPAGVGVAALIFVVGAVIVVLRRNQADLELLERGESPVKDREDRDGLVP